MGSLPLAHQSSHLRFAPHFLVSGGGYCTSSTVIISTRANTATQHSTATQQEQSVGRHKNQTRNSVHRAGETWLVTLPDHVVANVSRFLVALLELVEMLLLVPCQPHFVLDGFIPRGQGHGVSWWSCWECEILYSKNNHFAVLEYQTLLLPSK